MAIAVIISGFGALDGQIVATTSSNRPWKALPHARRESAGGHPTPRLVGNTIAS